MKGPMMQTPLETLVDFLMSLRNGEVPDSVAGQARLCLLDTVGCMIGGANTPEATQLEKAEKSVNPGEICSVAGRGRHSLLGAARINAYQGDIHELNDLIAGHASIGNVAAALALGQARGVSGAMLQGALVAGIEATSRVYNAFYAHQKPLEEVGIVSVGMSSTIGAAAACAHLLGLSREATGHALAIAAGWANWCPAEVIFGKGGTAKPMLFGALPACTAISAALSAEEGMSGPLDILTSNKGFFATIATEWDRTAFYPDDWALNAPRRKLHACCGYIHSSYEAAQQLVADGALHPEDIVSVRIEVPGYIIPAVSKSGAPTTPNEARFHLQFMLAQAFAGGGPVTPAMSDGFAATLERNEIRGLLHRFEVVGAADLSHYHQSRVIVVTVRGEKLVQANDAPRGTPRNPLSDTEVVAKYRRLASPVLGPEQTARLEAAFHALDQIEDVNTLCVMIEEPKALNATVPSFAKAR